MAILVSGIRRVVTPRRGIIRVMIIPRITLVMLLLNGSMARTRSELTMSNYVIQSPDPLLSQPFPDSINPDENISILSIERRKYIENTLNLR